MKEFQVDVDITMSRAIFVDAENAEEAKRIALEEVRNNPYYMMDDAACVDFEVVDVYEA